MEKSASRSSEPFFEPCDQTFLKRLTSEKNYFTEGRNDASKKEDRKEEKSEGFGDLRLRDDPDGTLGDPSTGAPAYHEIAPLV